MWLRINSRFFWLPFVLTPIVAATPVRNAIIQVPVADLRSAPVSALNGITDELQQTQLLFGEHVRVYESSGAWVRVEAIDQPSFKYHETWEGYPGWILSSTIISPPDPKDTDETAQVVIQTRWATFLEGPTIVGGMLPMGSFVKPLEKACLQAECEPAPVAFSDGSRRLLISSKDLIQPTYACRTDDPLCEVSAKRRSVVLAARQLAGVPYQWGGLTPNTRGGKSVLGASAIRGIDCSGLVHLAFRVNGMKVPRDSLEQWMKATPIRRAKMQPGDLIFSARPSNPKKIVHVTIYAGAGQLVEAPQTGLAVRQISFEEKYGVPLGRVESGQTVGDRVLYFGSFL